jgi:flagellar hook-basal body complex protein FliE
LSKTIGVRTPQENTMSIASIESVLQQMRVLAQASGHSPAAAGEVAGDGFAGELQKSLARISDTQQAAYTRPKRLSWANPVWRSTM